MAGPGPMCTWEQDHTTQDGTMCVAESRLPGTIQKRSPSVWDRVGALEEAYEIADGLVELAIIERTGYELGPLIKSFKSDMIKMLGATALSTLIGAGIGAAAAGPAGAVVGAKLGLDFAIIVFTWLGVAVLVVSIINDIGELSNQISLGVGRAWNAPEYPEREYPHQVQQAGKEIADAVAILFFILIKGMIAWILKRAGVAKVRGAAATVGILRGAGAEAAADVAIADLAAILRRSRLGSGFGDWLEKNGKSLLEDPKFKAKPVSEGGSGGGEGDTGSKDPTTRSKDEGASKELDVALEGQNRATVEKFMKENPMRYSPEKFGSYMDGIDLTKPVETKVLQPGDEFVMYQRPGAQAGTGSWATYEGVTPDQVGIIGEGRVPVRYKVTQPLTVIESTAKSYPAGRIDDLGGAGGGPQLCLPENWIQGVAPNP